MNDKFSLRRCRKQHSLTPDGFTLMELLIVMAIITILMLIGFPTYRSVMKHTRELSAKKSLQTIQEAEMMYAQSYPS
jgi:prepilin-type N-terminal cleavage/methylation domain-containing protein